MILYKYPINLYKTKFPMKANLIFKELKFIKIWKKKNIYLKIKKKFKNKSKFILHDGPPYANGDIHIGHAVNKILKDIIIKNKIMLGYNAYYIPGWDCHGMPIEIQIEKKFGKKISINKMQYEARIYANKQINKQKNDFIRLGILGDWNKIYKTMDFNNEANELKVFKKILKKGYIYRGLKPVYWCFNCKSSLAEAEIEYKKVKNISIYLGFKFIEYKKILHIFNIKKININLGYIVIWTTTPWTIISNKALSININFYYCLLKCILNKKIIFLLLSINSFYSFLKENNLKCKILNIINGRKLIFINFLNPLYILNIFYNYKSIIIPNKDININEGTGITHIAPYYGIEDFNLYKKFNLKNTKNLNSINKKGYFKKNIPIFNNFHIWKTTYLIIIILKKIRNFFLIKKNFHKYMYCWRHKTRVIYKSTLQWFINMDIITDNNKINLRKLALKEIKKINFYPKNNKNKFKTIIKKCPDWTLSRQRKWGVPIALFLNKKNNHLHPKTFLLLNLIIKKIKKYGIEIWQKINSPYQLIKKKKYKKKYKKINDILDVWFDSGVTHYTILQNIYKYNLSFPADLYLEGIDQYRGWFYSSLFTSLILKKCSPYKNILTHGFVVDKYGKKMSKSNGNVISPKQIINSLGAEILRLWVASNKYSKELSISKESLKRITEIYRKIRNTLRFLLSNLIDFNFSIHSILIDKLFEIDKYSLLYIKKLQKKILNFYENYKFHLIIFNIKLYCSEELSRFYLDIIKNRLYMNKINSISRRSVQTVFWYILNIIIRIISPILSFTSEEIWMYLNKKNKTIFIKKYFNIPYYILDKNILYKFKLLKKIKNLIFKKIEKYRKKKKIQSSLQIKLKLKLINKKKNILKKIKQKINSLLMVSSIKIISVKYKYKEKIIIKLSKKKKCIRCWNYCLNNDEKIKNLCIKCFKNLFIFKYND